MLTHARLAPVIGILFAVFATPVIHAADFSSYRGLQFGMDLTTAAKQAGLRPSNARTVHERPALIQELDWQLRSPTLQDNDPVKDGVLGFYNGELFRIVVTYDRFRIEGMTPADMIDAISATYGAASNPGVSIPYHSIYGEAADVIARWQDPEYSYNLVRSGDRSSYAMVLYSKRLDALAQASIVEAVRLDALEAPQKAIELQKDRQEQDRLATEKARTTNKPNFRP